MSLFGVVSYHSNSRLCRAAEVNKATQTLVLHILTHTAFYKISSPLGLFRSAVRYLKTLWIHSGNSNVFNVAGLFTRRELITSRKKIIYRMKLHLCLLFLLLQATSPHVLFSLFLPGFHLPDTKELHGRSAEHRAWSFLKQNGPMCQICCVLLLSVRPREAFSNISCRQHRPQLYDFDNKAHVSVLHVLFAGWWVCLRVCMQRNGIWSGSESWKSQDILIKSKAASGYFKCVLSL